MSSSRSSPRSTEYATRPPTTHKGRISGWDDNGMNKQSTNIAKGIAIIMMLFHHTFYSSKAIAERVGGEVAISYAPLSSQLIFSIAKSCKLCVPIFVFITGYGTYRSFRSWRESHGSQSAGSYVLTRHLRLLLQFLPIFVIGVTVCVLTGSRTLSGVYGGKGKIAGAFYMLVDAMGLAKAFGTPTFNGTWWYLSLAILFIYLLPPLVAFSDRFDSLALLAIVCLAPVLAKLKMTTDLTRYLPALVLGIACSQHHLLDWHGKHERPTLPQTLVTAAFAALAAGSLLFFEKKAGFTWFFHSVASLFVCELAVQIERLQGRILAFLGKHSSNMFMCHTFFLSMLLPKQLYSLGHWALIVLSLVSVSLLASVVLEFMKERGGYNALSDHVIRWVNGRVCSPDS